MEEDQEFDTEENSLLYPRIESIYSDVNIKTEPVDIDEDEYDSVDIDASSSSYYMPIRNKIILGSKPSTSVQSEPVAGPSTVSDNWEETENFFECAECNLLFPTQNELDSHKMASHSFLVARPLTRAIKSERISISSASSRSYLEEHSQEPRTRRQIAVKSTAKSSLNKTFPSLHNALKNNSPFIDKVPVTIGQKKDAPDMVDRFLCTHCKVIFPDEIALLKHTYELYPETGLKCDLCQKSFDSKASLKGHRAKHFKEGDASYSNVTMIQCNYCSCYLTYPGHMKTHLLKNHKVTEFAAKYVKFNRKCAVCSKVIKDHKEYNKHLERIHPKVFMTKIPYRVETSSVNMKCSICYQIFTSRHAAYKHKALKHPEQSQKHTFKTVHDKPIKQLPANPVLPHALKHKLQPKISPVNMTYIPKQALFKCNKCQIHFVNCSAAFNHSKRCSLAKGDWKCNKCRRTFTKTEKLSHMHQHQFSEKFKVHIVCDKILSKVLCRCPKCELLFDEVSFAEHVSKDCVHKNGSDCKICDLKIHFDSYAKHMRYHMKYNFASTDFILVEFVDVSFQVRKVKKEKEDFRRTLLYCSICNCHFYDVKPKLKFHLEGKCEDVPKTLCTTCGLCFSKKVYTKHTRYDHELLHLKLNEIKFLQFQDMKEINPVMPKFFQCKKCDVLFISSVHKNAHNCSKLMFQKCAKCSKKYDDISYNIHVAFHNYGTKTDDNKVEPIKLQFYSCVACSYGFHTYDSLVEHCQKHYINSEELETKPCKICKLNYAEPHKNLHSGRVTFEVLKFDYDKLLTDDWLAGFRSLSKEVLDGILSKSIYGAMRNIHLELLVEGPGERTIYKCAQCELNFEPDDIVDHTTETCSTKPCFECSSCNAIFKTKLAKNNHMNVHVIYGDDITFREIVFNNNHDKELNEALRTDRPKESLKFRKCQQCKLFIKKSDYQSHVCAYDDKNEMKPSETNYKEEIRKWKSRVNDRCVTYKLFKPIGDVKMYTTYKCRGCNACIMNKVNIFKHECKNPERYKQCRICLLNFLNCNITRHEQEHAVIPKFTPKNITVIDFQVLEDGGQLIRKRRRYSSDDDASTGAGVTVAVSKSYDTRKVIGKPYTDNLSEDSQDHTDDSSVKTSTPNAYAKKYIKKNIIEKDDTDNESSVSQDKANTPENIEDQLDTLDIVTSRNETKLYQCEKCYMCFSRNYLLLKHILNCDDANLSETPLICDQCELVFHPSIISFHEKLHKKMKKKYFYLVNIATNGVHTNDRSRWLYKCQPCDVHFLSTRSLEFHYHCNHKQKEYARCEICDLQFAKRSCAKHVKIHHEAGKLSKDDLHIEIECKKLVGEVRFNLRAFGESHSRNKECRVKIKTEDKDQSIEITIERDDLMNIDESVDDNTQSSQELENKIEDSNCGPDIIDHHLYKCNICSKHYLYKKTLIRHYMRSNHKMKPAECDRCGLLFDRRTLALHTRKQHGELKLSREDFVITDIAIDNDDTHSVCLSDNDTRECAGVVEKDMPDATDLNECDASLDGTITLNDEQTIGLSQDLKEVTKQLKIDGTGPIDSQIYKCVECNVFYTNRRTLLLHIIIKKHKQSDHLKCDICGLVFGRGSLAKHKNVQHGTLNLTRKDFIITDVFGSPLPDDEDIGQNYVNNKNNSSIDPNDLPLTELEENGVDKAKDNKEIKTFKTYQCKHCKVCVQKSESKLHVCCSGIQKKQCIKCCLYFRRTDVMQHNNLHRKYQELSRKNFVVTQFGRRMIKNNNIYKCVDCSTHFVSLNAIEWHMNRKHQTKRDHCKICGLYFGKPSLSRHNYIHHKKLNLTMEQINIIYMSDNNPTKLEATKIVNLNNSNDTASDLGATPHVKTVKKLFRCVECNVYFLTRVSYYHHIYNHKKLDETEYIECNICDFQFLNESLGVHMKTHKDKSFSLDHLLIEEYQPNSTNMPKIDLYFAKDSLNSKLVSTTTPFDNDEENVLRETDEQLSVIDSTSDEIPKGIDKVSEEDNSIPQNTDLVREDRTLNQTVEMPSSDITV